MFCIQPNYRVTVCVSKVTVVTNLVQKMEPAFVLYLDQQRKKLKREANERDVRILHKVYKDQSDVAYAPVSVVSAK